MTNNVFLPAIALGVTAIMLATPHVAAMDSIISLSQGEITAKYLLVGQVFAMFDDIFAQNENGSNGYGPVAINEAETFTQREKKFLMLGVGEGWVIEDDKFFTLSPIVKQSLDNFRTDGGLGPRGALPQVYQQAIEFLWPTVYTDKQKLNGFMNASELGIVNQESVDGNGVYFYTHMALFKNDCAKGAKSNKGGKSVQ